MTEIWSCEIELEWIDVTTLRDIQESGWQPKKEGEPFPEDLRRYARGLLKIRGEGEEGLMVKIATEVRSRLERGKRYRLVVMEEG